MSSGTENSKIREQPLEKSTLWWKFAVAIPMLIAAGILTKVRVDQMQPISTPQTTAPVAATVNALGRLEPQGEVLKLSAPLQSRVEKMLVKEGDKIRKGQVIAILDSNDTQKASVEQANAGLQNARASYAQVQASSPREIEVQRTIIDRINAQLRGEIITQQANINRLQAELKGQEDTLGATVARVAAEQRNALVDTQRYEYLYRQGAISQQEVYRRRLGAETANQQLAESRATRRQSIASYQQQIAQARANLDKTVITLQRQIQEEKTKLNRLLEIRPNDVEMARSQVNNAIANVKKAEAGLKLTYVMAPISGEILKVHAKSGEVTDINGVAEIGRTDRMIVVAEVPEDSIGRVRVGQKATIISDNESFSGQLHGTVTNVGRKIGKKDVLNTDPSADVDARVVEVKIALFPNDSERVSGLTYGKVVVDIDTK
jgi:HlyD family secretion protein